MATKDERERSEATEAGVVRVGDLAYRVTPPVKQERGAQVTLTGLARAAARGGLHGDVHSNTIARDAAVARGEAADGTTPDGSTPDGRLPDDTALGADQIEYGAPGEGEGKPGFRPGDREAEEARAQANEQRRAARFAAHEEAISRAQKPA